MIDNFSKKIIQETFENSFSKEKFTNFIKNLLNHFDDSEGAKFIYRGQTIPEVYRDKILSFERIGKYIDPEDKKIDILIVNLKNIKSLDKARTLQRNFIAWYLDGSRGGQLKDAALVAFVSPDSDSWRFSLVKMDYKIQDAKVKKDLTPAKRYSFLVGPQEKSHTAQSQLAPILDDNNNPILKEIENAFNVEKVTKEFFEKYRILFENIVGELKKNQMFLDQATKNNLNTENFAKKLLGQIVFLYFLQKKGWLGVPKEKSWGEGDKFFLRHLFDDCLKNNKNYFNDYLEILFYETLNNPRSDKVDRNFSSYFNSKIPFLNGGLFESLYDWKNSSICLDNNIFSNILSTFDLYNFTVKEDEPLEKEVGIDPEMLGKVFENLIEENLRKGKGAYYTPREIVHYMCQESLINYLVSETEIDKEVITKFISQIKYGQESSSDEIVKNKNKIIKALETIKIVDPACGSGAFLVGMLQEILRARQELDESLSEYSIKKHIIQNNIYGVDIDPGAVDIAKLRLWLSLIVDYSLEEIEPLPNLDYKIMVGNSLIEKLDIGLLTKSSDSKKNGLIDEIKEYKNNFFSTYNAKEKSTIRQKINERIRLLVNYENEQEREKLWSKIIGKRNQIKLFSFDDEQQSFADVSIYTNKLKVIKDIDEKDHFEWHQNFADLFEEKGGFDVIIANPPYVGESGNKEIFRPIANGNLSKFYQGKMDLFYFFFHLALNIGNPSSQCAFISTNYFITASGAKKFRTDLKERAIINKLINFNELKIFESALGQHNMISIFRKGQDKEMVSQNCITNRKEIANPEILDNIFSGIDSKTDYFSVKQKQLYDGDENYIRICGSGSTNNPTENLLEKIKESGTILEKICEINQGLVTGANKVSSQHIKKYKIKAEIGEGIFVINNKLKNKLYLTEPETFLLRPWFKNSDVFRWTTNIDNKESVFYLNRNEKSIGNNIERHLKKYISILKHRREVENGIINWWQTQWPREGVIFNEAKIVVPYRSKTNTFGYNEVPWYAASDVYFITQKDKQISLKYITALLNSKLYFLWLCHRGKRKGEILELFYQPLSEIPINKISETDQEPFIKIVDKILEITKSDDYKENPEKQAKVKDYEKQIDQMVYKLYELSPEEIKIVEESIK